MADKNIKIRISADGSAAIRDLDSATLSMKRLQAAAPAVTAAFAALSAAAGAVKFSEFVKDATLLAARVETLGVVMTKVGNNAGYSGETINKYAQGVAAMGITTEESRQTVIKMVQANLDLQKSAQLARVAQDAAVIGNTNSSEALQRLMHGITTLQPEVMRSVGIIVNLEQEYSKFAKSSGRTVQSLTSQEKQQIALNAVLEQGQKIAGSYEAAMDFVGKQMSSTARYSDELKLSVGEIFTPALGMAVKEYNNLLKDVGKWFKDNPETVKDWASSLVSALVSVKAEFMRMAMLVDKVGGTMTSAGMLLFGPGAALGNENSKKQFERLAQANIDFEARYKATDKALEQLAIDEQKLLGRIRSGNLIKDGAIKAAGDASNATSEASENATAKLKRQREEAEKLKLKLEEIRNLETGALEAGASFGASRLGGGSFLQTGGGGSTSYSLLNDTGSGIDASRYSLMGDGAGQDPSRWNMGDEELRLAEEQKQQMLDIENRYNQQMLASKMEFAEQSLGLLAASSKEGSAIQIAALVAMKALAVAQIIMNAHAAASAALLPPPVGLGPIAGQAISAQVIAMGYANAAIAGAVGIMQVANGVSGGREFGGPVVAGQSYLVGEKRPEIFTPNQSGWVTPRADMAGGGITQQISIDARGADSGVLVRIEAAMRRAKEEAKAEIMNSLNRGGAYSRAVGRA